jgi:hypothetical protein
MKKYDYYTAMYNDIADYVKDNNINLSEYGDNIEDITEKLSDELWGEDSITGNGGFGYDSNSNCEEYLCHNLDILFEAIYDFDFDTNYHHLDKDNLPKTLDSLIRCYLLNSVLYTYVKDN